MFHNYELLFNYGVHLQLKVFVLLTLILNFFATYFDQI
jgi:hypothetical protein